jgi:hypothetical protein
MLISPASSPFATVLVSKYSSNLTRLYTRNLKVQYLGPTHGSPPRPLTPCPKYYGTSPCSPVRCMLHAPGAAYRTRMSIPVRCVFTKNRIYCTVLHCTRDKLIYSSTVVQDYSILRPALIISLLLPPQATMVLSSPRRPSPGTCVNKPTWNQPTWIVCVGPNENQNHLKSD